jgi:glycosyltransferase involved in cell wall biosynthesis
VSARPKLVAVLSQFPCYDEVFLLRELAALAQQLELHVFSLRRSRDPLVHDQARPLLTRTLSPAYLLSGEVLGAQLSTLRRRPRAYLRALARLVRGNWRSPAFLVKNLAFFPKAIFLADWARRQGISHVHAGWATYPASVAMVAAEVAEIPFSFAGHAHDIYLDTTQLAEKVRHAAFVTVCTEANREHLLRLAPDVPPERVAVLRHGIAIQDFAAPARSRDRPLELLSVGTLFPHKGFAYLIDALRLLRERGLDFRCTLVGGGPLRTQLEERVRRNGLEARVAFTGPLKQAELVPLYRRAAVFVLMAQPEWHWGIPNVMIEALAARAAIITTRFGSVEELIRDGETGLLVPAKDPAALAQAIETLADDDELRCRLAEAGHRLVAERFDLEQTVRGYLERLGRSAASAAARPAPRPGSPSVPP